MISANQFRVTRRLRMYPKNASRASYINIHQRIPWWLPYVPWVTQRYRGYPSKQSASGGYYEVLLTRGFPAGMGILFILLRFLVIVCG